MTLATYFPVIPGQRRRADFGRRRSQRACFNVKLVTDAAATELSTGRRQSPRPAATEPENERSPWPTGHRPAREAATVRTTSALSDSGRFAPPRAGSAA